MKRLSNLLAALVFASLVIFMSCGGGGDDPAPTVEELAATDLVDKTWTVNSTAITFNSGPPDGDWSNFTLTFSGSASGGTFITTGVPDIDSGFEDIWPESGSWTFTVSGDRVTGISRNDGVNMTGTIGADALSLSFTVDSPTARTSGLYDAPWAFSFGVQ